jgi:hypothetical protein
MRSRRALIISSVLRYAHGLSKSARDARRSNACKTTRCRLLSLPPLARLARVFVPDGIPFKPHARTPAAPLARRAQLAFATRVLTCPMLAYGFTNTNPFKCEASRARRARVTRALPAAVTRTPPRSVRPLRYLRAISADGCISANHLKQTEAVGSGKTPETGALTYTTRSRPRRSSSQRS